jgi:hypothetical protein
MTSPSSQPAELHPRIQEVIDFLDVHRRALRQTIASVPARLQRLKPADGRWSVAEVVEHLSLLEHRIAGLLTMHANAARASGVGPDADTSSVVATFTKGEAVIDRSAPITAPDPVQPTGTLDVPAGERALEKSRAALVEALRNANGVSLENSMQKHPVLGTMNMYHWMVATALHDDRHAAQIRETVASLSAS